MERSLEVDVYVDVDVETEVDVESDVVVRVLPLLLSHSRFVFFHSGVCFVYHICDCRQTIAIRGGGLPIAIGGGGFHCY